MTKEDFGIQDLAQVYWVLVIPYLSLGLYEAVFIYPKGREINIQKEYFTTAIISVTAFVLLFIGVFKILPNSFILLLFPGKMLGYVNSVLILICTGVYQRIIQNFARGLDKMKVYSITGVLYAVVLCLGSVTLVPKFQLSGYFIALTSAQVFAIIYTFVAIKGWRYFSFDSYVFIRFKQMITYSIPLIPNATMWWIVNSLNRPFLISAVGLDGIGIFAVAHKFPSIIGIVFTVFFSAMQISAIEEFGKKGYSSFYNNVFRLLLFLQFFIAFGFILFSKLIFQLFVDPKFLEGFVYMPIMCVAVIISNLSIYVGLTFTALKETRYFLYSSILSALVAIAANFLFIPKFGIMGACLAICISQLSMFFYRWYKSYRYVNFTSRTRLIVMILSLVISLVLFYTVEDNILRSSFVLILFICFMFSNMDIFKNVRLLKEMLLHRKK